ncbi:MAG: hypothetical protein HWQ43_14570 [Nostoc sp. JL31]|nr:hypothetical protein [Nostoc sp. JL31]
MALVKWGGTHVARDTDGLEHRFSNQDEVTDCSVVGVKILALDMKIMDDGSTAKVK